jgi:uncharacterized protein (TIGR02444 family)
MLTDSSDAPSARDSAFWRFSLRFYALENVAPACIELQDKAGVDVNLMLFLLFLADDKRVVTAADVARLDSKISSWRTEVVMPLRDLRRKLKTGVGEIAPERSEAFRNLIKRVELESERLEQARLEHEAASLLTKARSREAAAEANLAAYAAHLGSLPAAPVKIILDAFTASAP